MSHFHELAKKYIRYQKDVYDYLQQQEKKFFEKPNLKVGGVLARGTDYIERKPYFNPIQPSAEELFLKADKYFEYYHCDKIFLATEDAVLLNKFERRYGDRLLFIDQQRVFNCKTELCDNQQFMSISHKLRGMQYLSAIYLLSKCKGLIAGRTAGTVGAVLMADNYEFVHVITKGRYGIDDAIIEKTLGW